MAHLHPGDVQPPCPQRSPSTPHQAKAPSRVTRNDGSHCRGGAPSGSLQADLGRMSPQLVGTMPSRLCPEMVIDVLVAAEFLFQAGLSEEKRELASTFVHRRMLPVEMAARRISSGDASRLKRYDRWAHVWP